MPHMDMSGGSSGEVDYSDFRYQHVEFLLDVNNDADGADRSAVAGVDIDPLEDKAGLDVNEVAELVAYEIHVGLEFEAETADQNVASSTEARGVFGINLGNDVSQLLQESENFAGTDQIIEAGDKAIAVGHSLTDDAVLNTFRVHGSPAFDDAASGPGGGGPQAPYQHERNYRELTGRGPIVDSQDTISCVQKLITGDSLLQEGVRTRVSLVWDIMENDDAGRRFAVPSR